jgi:hypothetical protein
MGVDAHTPKSDNLEYLKIPRKLCWCTSRYFRVSLVEAPKRLSALVLGPSNYFLRLARVPYAFWTRHGPKKKYDAPRLTLIHTRALDIRGSRGHVGF